MKKPSIIQMLYAGGVGIVALLTLVAPPARLFGGEVTPDALSYLPYIINDGPTATPTAMPTSTPTATPTSNPLIPNVVIDLIEYNPAGSDLEGEFVRIKNNSGTTQDLTGWRLHDESVTTFVFPSFTLANASTVTVWVKSGTNTATNLYWDNGRSIWNNDGDTGYLKNSQGDLVDTCPYAGGGTATSCN